MNYWGIGFVLTSFLVIMGGLCYLDVRERRETSAIRRKIRESKS